MAKQIFYLQSCDIWKSTDSMRLLFIGTSPQKLMMKISEEIEEGNMEYKPVTTTQEYDFERKDFYCVEKKNSPKEQVKLFRQDFKTKTRDIVNSNLDYGYFNYTYNNEAI